MRREPYKGVQLRLEHALGARVVVKPRVDAPNALIVVVDAPELPENLHKVLRETLPQYLTASTFTYAGLRDAARDPNSPLEVLIAAAHILPKSVALNPILDWIALEDAAAAERLRALL